MSNFAFLPDKFKTITEGAARAESYIIGDPRAACFHARYALEQLVKWLYQHDGHLRSPTGTTLSAMIFNDAFRRVVPTAIFMKARVIKDEGNIAVHEARPVAVETAMNAVKELHHICYWLTRTYTPDASRQGAGWRDDRVPQPPQHQDVVPRNVLKKMEAELAARDDQVLQQQQKIEALDQEIQQMREANAQTRIQSQAVVDDHDYSEAETRRYLIDVALRRAGWDLDAEGVREFPVTGMPDGSGGLTGKGRVDYVLWDDNGLPLAVVEAKRATKDARAGKQQALLYANALRETYGRLPVMFYTNGYQTWYWDHNTPERPVSGFFSKGNLQRLVLRHEEQKPLDAALIKPEIAGRYYQKQAISAVLADFADGSRRALLVMATGTGKTRTAIALTDVLAQCGWAKNVLFLADRRELVKQAANAYKQHLPNAGAVNLVTGKGEGRVYLSTYPTMMNLIDQSRDGQPMFGPAFFDLIIIDEAHRSIYQRYSAIFDYFDAFLVGLTATPAEEVDRDSYRLFQKPKGQPSFAYELDTAVKDGFLVPPKVLQVDLKFPQRGIAYDLLSEDEKQEWESADWGDLTDEGKPPAFVDAAAINQWLLNMDTVDKVLEVLMTEGYRVDGGDRLAKTIIFARNHRHAEFIEARFNLHYPGFKGLFARVIDNHISHAESLIDDFRKPEGQVHIAISVDMLDTGLDVPEIANLVFFKPVYSKIKFWQMIGRGTRICEGLFGPSPEGDKPNFRVFDFCGVFQFFKEKPEGFKTGAALGLSTKLFQSRVHLLCHLYDHPQIQDCSTLREGLKRDLHAAVSSMAPDNFMVRQYWEVVSRFHKPETWEQIAGEDRRLLKKAVAALPTSLEPEHLNHRRFDLVMLKLQTALGEGQGQVFLRYQQKVVETAALLEEKGNIPKVKEQLDFIREVQEPEFWSAPTQDLLEELRLRLRGLTSLLTTQGLTPMYTDFEDEILGQTEVDVMPLPKMTGDQYRRKVEDYLRDHRDHLVIHRLRANQPLTPTDLEGLKQMLVEIGQEDGETLLAELLKRSESPSLPCFVRKLVGMDRKAAMAAFSQFLSDTSLTPRQMRFVEMIVEQLTQRGVMAREALYDRPFIDLYDAGPDHLFGPQTTDALFLALDQAQANLDDSVA